MTVFFKHRYFILFLIICLGTFLRLVNIDLHPLWIDEAYSYWFSSQSWRYLWTEVPTFETHPSFYYSLLKLWREAFGTGEGAMRSLSAMLSLLAIPLIYKSARIISPTEKGTGYALFCAFIMATLPFQILYAQEARPYALMVFAMSLTILCVLWVIKNPESLKNIGRRTSTSARVTFMYLLGLSVGLALLAWSHNIGLIYACVIGLVLILWWLVIWRANVKVFITLLLTALLSALLYSPNIGNLLYQTSMVSQSFWLTAPDRWTVINTGLTLYSLPVWSYLHALNITDHYYLFLYLNALIGGIVILLSMWGLRALSLAGSNSSLKSYTIIVVLTLGACLPFLMSLALSYTVKPVFLDRTLIACQIPAILIIGAMPWALPALFKRILIILLGALYITLSSHSLITDRYTETTETKDKYIIAQLIIDEIADKSKNINKTAPIFIGSNTAALLFDYYNAQYKVEFQSVPLPEPYPAIDETYTYNAGSIAVPEITKDALEAAIQKHAQAPYIWVVKRRADLFDPDNIMDDMLKQEWPCKTEIYKRAHWGVSFSKHSKDITACRNLK